jgi:hypothetical protein
VVKKEPAIGLDTCHPGENSVFSCCVVEVKVGKMESMGVRGNPSARVLGDEALWAAVLAAVSA